MIGVLIAESDPMVSALLELYVRQSRAYRVVGSMRCEDVTPDAIRDCAAHLVLIGVEGIVSAGWIKAQIPDVKLIAMTAAPEHSYMAKARACGADSFWYQSPDAAALIDIMDRTMAGESVYPRQMTVLLGQARSSDLTEREMQVLREVVSGNTDAQIAQHLGISLRTVKGHIQNLREKTGYRNRTELAVQARASGLIIHGTDKD